MAGESEPEFSVPAPVRPGDVLAKKYEITRLLGAGGMGVVVAANDIELDRRVAVKFLSPEGAANPSIVTRFMREARAAVKITSEHVAKVIEVGRLEAGEPYIVMEFLEGCDLADAVAGGPLPIDDAMDYVLQACEAIAEAHAKGIVHRDLKPANLFLSKRADGSPIVKVLDFGISSMAAAGVAEHALTRTGAIMGSPFYMSPEQAKSARSADARSDIWSLGAVLYELIAGRPPFSGETMGELIAAILTAEPPPLGGVRADLPEGLAAVVMRCLSKEPSGRYASVGDFAQALAPFAPQRARVSVTRAVAVSASPRTAAAGPADDALPAGGTLVMPEASRATAEGGNTAAAWAETRAPATPARGWKIGAVVAAGVAVAGVGLGVLFNRSGSADAPAASAALGASEGASAAHPALLAPSAAPLAPTVASSADDAGPAASEKPSATTKAPAAPATKKPATTPSAKVAEATPPAKPETAPPGKPAASAKPTSAKPPSLAMPLE